MDRRTALEHEALLHSRVARGCTCWPRVTWTAPNTLYLQHRLGCPAVLDLPGPVGERAGLTARLPVERA